MRSYSLEELILFLFLFLVRCVSGNLNSGYGRLEELDSCSVSGRDDGDSLFGDVGDDANDTADGNDLRAGVINTEASAAVETSPPSIKLGVS